MDQTRTPLTTNEQAMVLAVKNGDRDPAGIAKAHGFQASAAGAWSNSRPRAAYQTYARSRGTVILRKVGERADLPPWRILVHVGDMSTRPVPILAERGQLEHYDLWPSDDEGLQPVSTPWLIAACLLGVGILGVIVGILGVIAWCGHLLGFWGWPW